jgi:hypothetical protein
MRMLITRNGPTQKGMYELGEVEHRGGVTPQTVNTDVELCQRLRSHGVTESIINEVVTHLQHKRDYAALERKPSGEWMVTRLGNQKED